jgi:hypothetical protein
VEEVSEASRLERGNLPGPAFELTTNTGDKGQLSLLDPGNGLVVWVVVQSTVPFTSLTFFEPSGNIEDQYFGNFVSGPAPVPLPPSLVLQLTGIGLLGLLGWRRRSAMEKRGLTASLGQSWNARRGGQVNSWLEVRLRSRPTKLTVSTYAFLVYMLSPLPRRSDWGTASLIRPSHVCLPRYGSRVGLRIDLFEVCSAFTRVTACTLALSPYFVTRYPKASATSFPP